MLFIADRTLAHYCKCMIYLTRLKYGNGSKFRLLETKHCFQQTELCEHSDIRKNMVVLMFSNFLWLLFQKLNVVKIEYAKVL